MKNRDLSKVLLIVLLVLSCIYMVNEDRHTNMNRELKQILKEEKELFSKELRKKDSEIEQLNKKVAILEKDIALQEVNK